MCCIVICHMFVDVWCMYGFGLVSWYGLVMLRFRFVVIMFMFQYVHVDCCVLGFWFLWYLLCALCYVLFVLRSLVLGLWYFGIWSLVFGIWSLVLHGVCCCGCHG